MVARSKNKSFIQLQAKIAKTTVKRIGYFVVKIIHSFNYKEKLPKQQPYYLAQF